MWTDIYVAGVAKERNGELQPIVDCVTSYIMEVINEVRGRLCE